MAFSTAFGTLTTGAFIIGFAKSLGASDQAVNLLIALPSLVGAIGIPGAIWGRSFPTYRGVVRPGGLAWRAMYLGLVALPLLPFPMGLRLAMVLLLVPVATAANALMGSIYNEWMSEIVPPDSRGFFFGRRQAVSTAVGAVVGLLGGFVLDAFRGAGREPLGFAVVFGLGSVCAAVSMGFFDRIRDVPRADPVRQSVREGLLAIRDPFRDREFRPVLLYLAATVFSQTMPGGLFTVFALDVLRLDYKVVAGLALSYSVGIVLATRLWSFLADRYGNKPMLAVSGALMALNVVPWTLAPPGNPALSSALLLTTHVVMGAFFCGMGLCQFNLLLSTAKPTDRANYIAAGTAVMAVTGGVAPMVGAAFMPAHPGEWAYKTLFLATGLLRLLTVPLLFSVKESGSTTIRETLGVLRRVTPRGVGAMRRLNRSEDAEARAEAIQAVAEEGAELAGDAILAALSDPQPRVRREAARALARLRDSRAVAALLAEIEAAPEALEEETIDALGDLADPAAVPALLAAMENPRPLLRRSAARALGRIGGLSVVPALERAVREGDTDLRRAALQGLRRTGAREAAETIAHALADPHPSVRTAAAEAVSELELRAAAPALRAVLGTHRDEADAEAAYALGVVGEPDDLPAILREAARARSTPARRPALLGASRLLNAEREAYRLMLLSGMARDTAIVERLKPLRDSASVRLALMRYGAGDEEGALDALTRARPELAPLTDVPVEEAFLVAAAAA